MYQSTAVDITPDILMVTKAARIRWFGHVMRVPESCFATQVGTEQWGVDQVEQNLHKY